MKDAVDRIVEGEVTSMGRGAHLVESAGLLNGRVRVVVVRMDPIETRDSGNMTETRVALWLDGKPHSSAILEMSWDR